ncbi:cysteine-rich receptor-like protein kinase 2 [Prosopis cineraria]|uniref:cysteine-rich receptor-like protein kinase 2 n=1 Tax=Prosopis cineraria TaxID=364024 RepID=UPI00240ED9CC|nr:cysteine-rich receptor-like protein kinase 2 [Prosopis cineraria]
MHRIQTCELTNLSLPKCPGPLSFSTFFILSTHGLPSRTLNSQTKLRKKKKKKLQPHLLPLITLLFCSCWILDGVVSEPQTHFLNRGCNPYAEFLVSNVTLFGENIKASLRDIREQIGDQNTHFATAQQAGASGGNTVSTLFQCRSYLSIADCVACFDVAAPQIFSCAAGDLGGHVVYDGCYLRYDISSAFFGDTTQSVNSASCGSQTTEEPATVFTSAVHQVLMNLQTATPRITAFSAATKTQVSDNGATIYAFAQCIQTITSSKCEDCLNAQYNNMQTCLPNSDGRAYANGCFLRYSTTSFFPDNQTIDITTPFFQQGSSNKGAIIGGLVGSVVALALIFIALFVLIRQRRKRPQRVPRGDIIGASKLKGPTVYNYKDLKTATKNFSQENKLGEGGFGVVYKGTLKNGKEVAVKKLTFRHLFTRMEEDFESEVKLINNVHHRNLTLSYYQLHIALVRGYTAPEYAIHGQLSEKADVFSYGIIVLEMISGQRSEELKIHGNDEGEFLLQKRGIHSELVDKTLDPNDFDVEEVKKVIEIGLLCTQAHADIKPTMSEVVVLLQNMALPENIKPTMPLLIEAT